MVIIKRLHTFMLQQFLPLLIMTFFICVFIVLMQFLWVHLKDLVGKGLSIDVIGELFFYAALSMVPTALPLAVLLASLMTFGNLGEKFELTALKAAGISLFSIMKPLIIFMVLLAIGAFFFQNNVLPVAQTKMWTLLFSMRQKSPEMEIPERTFYDQIPGMNLYVDRKNQETGVLYDMIIYDISRGLDNSRVILADSGKLNFTEDKTHLFLHLYRGEMFENLKDNAMGSSSSNYLPFRRESFTDKQIYFVFDANFNMIDESAMRNQYIGKNIKELSQSIDSLNHMVDSIGDTYAEDIKTRNYANVPYYKNIRTDSGMQRVVTPPVTLAEPLDLDSIFAGSTPSDARNIIAQALAKAKRQKQDYDFKSTLVLEQAKLMRRHGIELQRRFTLSFACLIFFFIGAPLGAIIKKGGIGTPLVISVFLFIVYYIFDNMGFKMARDGKVLVWEGVWLSSAVLLPLGIFFTYKAVGDSQVFNMDAYTNFFNRLIGRRPKRGLVRKEVIMAEVDPQRAQELLARLLMTCEELLTLSKRPPLKRLLHPANYAKANAQLTEVIDHLSNSRSNVVISRLNDYPFRIMRRDLPSVIKTTQELQRMLASSSPTSPL
ncbi:MAG: LptF/LptG family permease [Bacteroidales bacterium]|nr:LptF/LptG family permease [Bacteroidales bacterium]